METVKLFIEQRMLFYWHVCRCTKRIKKKIYENIITKAEADFILIKLIIGFNMFYNCKMLIKTSSASYAMTKA